MSNIYKQALELFHGYDFVSKLKKEPPRIGIKESTEMIVFFLLVFSERDLKEQLKASLDFYKFLYEDIENPGIGKILTLSFDQAILTVNEYDKLIATLLSLQKRVEDEHGSCTMKISIHKGSLVLGNWGSLKHMQEIVYGLGMDIAKGMIEVVKDHESTVLISEDAISALNVPRDQLNTAGTLRVADERELGVFHLQVSPV